MQPVITPTVTAFDTDQYKQQTDLIRSFAKRVHLDLMDGKFAPTQSPPLEELWPLENIIVDLHVMYERPQDYLPQLLALKPNLVVFHREADIDHAAFARQLHEAGVRAGIAVLQKTPIADAETLLPSFEHLLVFSGNLGYHGGSTAELSLLAKAQRALQLKPELEIGWDGGINDQNACALVHGGVSVLNTGGYIHKSADPAATFRALQELVNNA